MYTRTLWVVFNYEHIYVLVLKVVFDEAHKYLSNKSGDLCDDVVRIARQMRHYGMRLIVSTQNPEVLSKELLELSSFVLLHRFDSPGMLNYSCLCYCTYKIIIHVQ